MTNELAITMSIIWNVSHVYFTAFSYAEILSIGAKTIKGDAPFYAKIWPKLSHPFQNADFQSIFAGSTPVVTLCEK